MKAIAPSMALLPLLISSTIAAPTRSRSHCRCMLAESEKPWASSLTLHNTPAVQNDYCSSLGPEVEKWESIDPDLYRSFFDVDEKPISLPKASATGTSDERPLSTTVLMAMGKVVGSKGAGNSKNNIVGEHNNGKLLPSAPTQRPKIICRTVVDEVNDDSNSSTTLFVIGIIIIMAILALMAEGLNLLLNCIWKPTQHRRIHSIRLTGEEKTLLAYSMSQERLDRLGSVSEKVPDYACTAYLVEPEDEQDEERRPVL
ncbi:hypothetical protein GQ43DRAFT_476174 [Delitschia confertaspora ATCC 74209]|uniref:Uncharacterized protein n=1 Tax=Delitschia confertaspora ATCC 74209 TaxID=1513339 RepID=A0A9P4JBT8_9PLEO|nr:hypothetical protein GQ43DRAFT_476174 [Delitschia confertaspora ATCC 74209]